jgi:protein LTV1
MRHRFQGETGAERLGALREAMGKDHRVGAQSDDSSGDYANDLSFEEEDDRGDCETVLSMCRCVFYNNGTEHTSATYSNLENHPQVIRARVAKQQPLPRASPNATKRLAKNGTVDIPMSFASDSKSMSASRVTVTRPCHETKEDKKVRKQVAKAIRQSRRKKGEGHRTICQGNIFSSNEGYSENEGK